MDKVGDVKSNQIKADVILIKRNYSLLFFSEIIIWQTYLQENDREEDHTHNWAKNSVIWEKQSTLKEGLEATHFSAPFLFASHIFRIQIPHFTIPHYSIELSNHHPLPLSLQLIILQESYFMFIITHLQFKIILFKDFPSHILLAALIVNFCCPPSLLQPLVDITNVCDIRKVVFYNISLYQLGKIFYHRENWENHKHVMFFRPSIPDDS